MLLAIDKSQNGLTRCLLTLDSFLPLQIAHHKERKMGMRFRSWTKSDYSNDPLLSKSKFQRVGFSL